MPRPPSPNAARLLIDRAASMLTRREPVTLRSVVAGTGLSTMAVYTYFDGMPGLWSAVRQEGFQQLAQRLASVEVGKDPVRDLASLGVAYIENGLANPDLYRVMFDATFALPDPEVAAGTFDHLTAATQRCIAAGRFRQDNQPSDIALRYWITGHGITSLGVTDVLALGDLRKHAPLTTAALFIDAGDVPERACRSVQAAWRGRPLIPEPHH